MKRKLPVVLSCLITVALVFISVIVVIAVTPRITRTDGIIKKVTSLLKIDLDDNGASYTADDIKRIKFKEGQKQSVLLKKKDKDKKGRVHTVNYNGFTIYVNSKAPDFKRKVKKLRNNKQAVIDKADSVISSYTYDDISEIQVMNELLDDLKKEYGKEMILNMEFKDFKWK